MNADWAQARIAELERVNAALVAERDEARAELAICDDLLLFHQDTIKAMRVALPGFVTPYPAPDDPDEDELIARLETTVGGWTPGTTAGKDCRGNVGAGYLRSEGEGS